MRPAPPDPLPESFLPLHPLEFRILMILLEGPSHGYAMVREIEKSEDDPGRIYPANLYRRIRDLLAHGLLEEADRPGAGGDDPRRRYFRISALGREVAAAETSRMRRLLEEALARGLRPGRGVVRP